MKAIIYTEYGGPDVLHPQEVEKPSPRSNEVLIRVHAVSVPDPGMVKLWLQYA